MLDDLEFEAVMALLESVDELTEATALLAPTDPFPPLDA